MDSTEKRRQILELTEKNGIKLPKTMPEDFLFMEYADGCQGASDYAYFAARSIFAAAELDGELDSAAKKNLKTVLAMWSNLVYAKGLESVQDTIQFCQDIYKSYQSKAQEKLKHMNQRKEVIHYIDETVHGLTTMQGNAKYNVGTQDDEYYKKSIAILQEIKSYVEAAVDVASRGANALAKTILFGADGNGGIVQWRSKALTRLTPQINLLEESRASARAWSRLSTYDTKKVKPQEAVVWKEDEFGLFAKMSGIGAGLGQFYEVVSAEKNASFAQLARWEAMQEAKHQELFALNKEKEEFIRLKNNGELTRGEAIRKVEKVQKSIADKNYEIQLGEENQRTLDFAIGTNKELYGAVERLKFTWDMSESILSLAERHELFGTFPYEQVLQVLNGDRTHEGEVGSAISVMIAVIDIKVEERAAISERYRELWEKMREGGKTERKNSETGKKQILQTKEEADAAEERRWLELSGGSSVQEKTTPAEKEDADRKLAPLDESL